MYSTPILTMPILYGIQYRLGFIKDLEKVQMRATKLVPGNYCKTP